MKTLAMVLAEKRDAVFLERGDIFMEQDDPQWRVNHPVGPVHVQVVCLLCEKVLATDLKEYGWLGNDSFYGKHLQPHLAEHR